MSKKPKLPSIDNAPAVAATVAKPAPPIVEAPMKETPELRRVKVELELPVVLPSEADYISRQVNVKLSPSQARVFRALCNGLAAAYPSAPGTTRSRHADGLKFLFEQIESQIT